MEQILAKFQTSRSIGVTSTASPNVSLSLKEQSKFIIVFGGIYCPNWPPMSRKSPPIRELIAIRRENYSPYVQLSVLLDLWLRFLSRIILPMWCLEFRFYIVARHLGFETLVQSIQHQISCAPDVTSEFLECWKQAQSRRMISESTTPSRQPDAAV